MQIASAADCAALAIIAGLAAGVIRYERGARSLGGMFIRLVIFASSGSFSRTTPLDFGGRRGAGVVCRRVETPAGGSHREPSDPAEDHGPPPGTGKVLRQDTWFLPALRFRSGWARA